MDGKDNTNDTEYKGFKIEFYSNNERERFEDFNNVLKTLELGEVDFYNNYLCFRFKYDEDWLNAHRSKYDSFNTLNRVLTFEEVEKLRRGKNLDDNGFKKLIPYIGEFVKAGFDKDLLHSMGFPDDKISEVFKKKAPRKETNIGSKIQRNVNPKNQTNRNGTSDAFWSKTFTFDKYKCSVKVDKNQGTASLKITDSTDEKFERYSSFVKYSIKDKLADINKKNSGSKAYKLMMIVYLVQHIDEFVKAGFSKDQLLAMSFPDSELNKFFEEETNKKLKISKNEELNLHIYRKQNEITGENERHTLSDNSYRNLHQIIVENSNNQSDQNSHNHSNRKAHKLYVETETHQIRVDYREKDYWIKKRNNIKTETSVECYEFDDFKKLKFDDDEINSLKKCLPDLIKTGRFTDSELINIGFRQNDINSVRGKLYSRTNQNSSTHPTTQRQATDKYHHSHHSFQPNNQTINTEQNNILNQLQEEQENNKQLVKQLKQVTAQNQILNQELQSANSSLINLQDKNSKLEKESNENLALLDKATNLVEKQDYKIKQQENKITQLKKDVKTTQTIQRNVTEQLKEKIEENKELRTKINDLTEKLNEAKNNLKTIKDSSDKKTQGSLIADTNLNTEINSLKEQIGDLVNKQKDVKSLESEVNRLKKENEKLNEQMKGKTNDIKYYRDAEEGSAKRNELLGQKIDKLQSTINNTLEKENKALRQQITDKDSEITSLTSKNEKLTKHYSRKVTFNTNSTQDGDNKQKQIDELQKEIVNKTMNITELEQVINSLNKRISQQQNQKTDDDETITDLNKQITELQAQILSITNEKGKLEGQNDQLNAIVGQLQNQETNNNEEKRGLNYQIDQLNAKITELQAQILSITNEKGKLEGQNDQLNEIVGQLQEQKANNSNAIERLKLEILKLQQKGVDDDKEKRNLSKKISQLIYRQQNQETNNNEEKRGLNYQIDQLNAKITELQAQILSITNEKGKLEGQNDQLNEIVGQLQEQKANNSNAIERLKLEILKLQQKGVDDDNGKKALNEQIAFLKQKKYDLEQQVDKLNIEKYDLNRENKDKDDEISRLRESILKLQDKLSRLQEETHRQQRILNGQFSNGGTWNFSETTNPSTNHSYIGRGIYQDRRNFEGRPESRQYDYYPYNNSNQYGNEDTYIFNGVQHLEQIVAKQGEQINQLARKLEQQRKTPEILLPQSREQQHQPERNRRIYNHNGNDHNYNNNNKFSDDNNDNNNTDRSYNFESSETEQQENIEQTNEIRNSRKYNSRNVSHNRNTSYQTRDFSGQLPEDVQLPNDVEQIAKLYAKLSHLESRDTGASATIVYNINMLNRDFSRQIALEILNNEQTSWFEVLIHHYGNGIIPVIEETGLCKFIERCDRNPRFLAQLKRNNSAEFQCFVDQLVSLNNYLATTLGSEIAHDIANQENIENFNYRTRLRENTESAHGDIITVAKIHCDEGRDCINLTNSLNNNQKFETKLNSIRNKVGEINSNQNKKIQVDAIKSSDKREIAKQMTQSVCYCERINQSQKKQSTGKPSEQFYNTGIGIDEKDCTNSFNETNKIIDAAIPYKTLNMKYPARIQQYGNNSGLVVKKGLNYITFCEKSGKWEGCARAILEMLIAMKLERLEDMIISDPDNLRQKAIDFVQNTTAIEGNYKGTFMNEVWETLACHTSKEFFGLILDESKRWRKEHYDIQDNKIQKADEGKLDLWEENNNKNQRQIEFKNNNNNNNVPNQTNPADESESDSTGEEEHSTSENIEQNLSESIRDLSEEKESSAEPPQEKNRRPTDRSRIEWTKI